MACICRALARQKDRREEGQKEGKDREEGRKKEEKVGHISFLFISGRCMLGTPPASWTWGVSHTLTCKQVKSPLGSLLFCFSRSEVVPMSNTPIKQCFCS